MNMPNAYQLACYNELGVDLATLGCVMLDVELPSYVSAVIEPEWSYTSANPKLRHVAGVPSDHHVTLKFGLMRNAHAWKAAIDEVLSGWQIPDVLHVTEIASFASPLPDAEPYRCIIMKPWAGALFDAHQRLSLLPHIDTHASYVPHITLGYVQEQHAARAIERLDHLCLEQQLSCKVLGMNYGEPPPAPEQL